MLFRWIQVTYQTYHNHVWKNDTWKTIRSNWFYIWAGFFSLWKQFFFTLEIVLFSLWKPFFFHIGNFFFSNFENLSKRFIRVFFVPYIFEKWGMSKCWVPLVHEITQPNHSKQIYYLWICLVRLSWLTHKPCQFVNSQKTILSNLFVRLKAYTLI